MMKADDFSMTASSLDPFDEEMICPKCGFGRIEIAYCEGHKSARMHPFTSLVCMIQGEHLHGRCERCGYLWEMATLDSATIQRPHSMPRPPHPMDEGTTAIRRYNVGTMDEGY